jgi:transposase
MTRDVVIQNPLSGHLFVFRNRTGNRLKILYWEGAGFCLVYRRLEKGTYRFPPAPTTPPTGHPQDAASAPQPASLEIDGGDLAMIIEGIELESARRHKRFELPANVAVAP